MDKTPTFCKYIFHEAREQNLSIEDYIDQRIPRLKEDYPNHFSPGLNIKFVFADEKPIEIEEALDEAIKKVKLDDLKRAAEWYANEISRFIQRNNKIVSFQNLLDIGEFATTPDLDQLDRLMRYQTSLQRQLSSAIGELLTLIKS